MKTLLLIGVAFALLASAVSCGGGGGGGGPEPVKEAVDYLLVTGLITQFAGPSKDVAELKTLAQQLAIARVYDFGLGRETASSSERVTLGASGFTSGLQSTFTPGAYGYVADGAATILGDAMLVTLNIPMPDGSRYSGVKLEGLFNHAGGQDLINIVRGYGGADRTTDVSIDANYTLTGHRAGELFSIQFTQQLRGRYDKK
jgi:hypothetical protein